MHSHSNYNCINNAMRIMFKYKINKTYIHLNVLVLHTGDVCMFCTGTVPWA